MQKQKITGAFPAYGSRLPLRDATQSVSVTITARSLKEGQPRSPDVCAISISAGEQKEKFPHKFLAALTYKTYTIVAVQIGDNEKEVLVLRYLHDSLTRRHINDFDSPNASQSFKAGDVVTLLVPTGRNRLGQSHPTHGPKPKRPYRVHGYNACHKRGIFIKPEHEAAHIRILGAADLSIARLARRAV